MASALFRRLAAAGRNAVERVHGEAIIVRPMHRHDGPNVRREPDPNRSVFETIGCFYENSANETSSDAQPLVPGLNQKLAHRSPKITASIRFDPDTPIRTGDIIERVSVGQFYEVTEINRDGLGGALMTLAASRGHANA